MQQALTQAETAPVSILVNLQMKDLINKVIIVAAGFYVTRISFYTSLTNLLSHSEKVSKVAQPILDRVSSLPILRLLPSARLVAFAPVIAKLIHMILIYADSRGKPKIPEALKTSANRAAQGLGFLWGLRFSLFCLGVSKTIFYQSVFFVIYSLASLQASWAPYDIAALEELFDKANDFKGDIDNLAKSQGSIETIKSETRLALNQRKISETHASSLDKLTDVKHLKALKGYILLPGFDNFLDSLNDDSLLTHYKKIAGRDSSEEQATERAAFLKELSQLQAHARNSFNESASLNALKQFDDTIKKMDQLIINSKSLESIKCILFIKIEQLFNNIIIPNFKLNNLLDDNYEKIMVDIFGRKGIIHKFKTTLKDWSSADLISAQFLLRRFEFNLKWYIANQSTYEGTEAKEDQIFLQGSEVYKLITYSEEFIQWMRDEAPVLRNYSRKALVAQYPVKAYIMQSPLFEFAKTTHKDLNMPDNFRFATENLAQFVRVNYREEESKLYIT